MVSAGGRGDAGRGRELAALKTVTAHFADAAELGDVTHAVLTLGLRAVGAVRGAVLVYDAELKTPSLEESVAYPPDTLERLRRADRGGEALAAMAAPRGRPVFIESLEEARERFPALLAILADGSSTGAVVPLFSGEEHIGSLLLAFADEQPFSEDRRDLALALGQVCQEALVHSRRRRVERRIVETFQRSLLPARLSDVPRLDVSVRYLARAVETDVGGDWYDEVVLDDGRVVLTVGDVAGSGVQAAAVMGRLRITLKAYAVDGLSPAESLMRLDAFVERLPEDYFATAVVLRLDPTTGLVEYAIAGHPPPLLIPGQGENRYLEGARSLPIDTGGRLPPRTDGAIRLVPGDALLLYSDGLVERRDRPIVQGMSLLARALQPSRNDGAETLVRRATDELLGDDPVPDDVVLLAVKLRDER